MRLSAPPGEIGQAFAEERATTDVLAHSDDELWDSYLEAPSEERLGICTSGGGIRSASFSLGALQVLREAGLLDRAKHLSCVSGGGYTAIAQALMVSETLKRADVPDPSEAEHAYFGRLPPWSQGSPEESHLRNHVEYLGAGLVGRVWIVANLVYGAVRHFLPFATVVYLGALIVGLGMSPWLRETLQTTRGAECVGRGCVQPGDLLPFLWLSLVLFAVAGLVMGIRNAGQKRAFTDSSMFLLQYLAIAIIACALAVMSVMVLLPRVLLLLHDGTLDSVTKLVAVNVTSLAGTIAAVVAWVAKNRRTRWFHIGAAVITALAAPIVVLVPFVGVTYWNAEAGLDWSDQGFRFVLAGIAAVYVVLLWRWLDEVTSVAHLFYRERLAKSFVGYRRFVKRHGGPALLRYAEPPWDQDLDFSTLGNGTGDAKMPNLIVCTAVNLSGDLPVGRMGASFTFERDVVGGPSTGYMPTPWIEQRAGSGVVTLPALMAISGAAVSPSMGKMTLPAFRFLMALFDLRLGAWLPNPYTSPMRATPSELREQSPMPKDPDEPEPAFLERQMRPGALYVLREAFGWNSIHRPFVYVTDGGHWENLGLVELLRRGCGRIICIDGSGGDAVTFGTLSEAIALARSDLGVEITIDLSMMRAAKGEESELGFALGRITFPDGRTAGTLVYIRALLAKTVPEDLRSYAGKDKKFPNHPTSDQFFDEERFEAYRALGQHLTRQALDCGAASIKASEPEPVCP